MLYPDLYQEIIIHENKHPHNYYKPDTYTAKLEAYNPLCGDQYTIYIAHNNTQIEKIFFTGHGCAISKASTSMLAKLMENKTWREFTETWELLHEHLTTPKNRKLTGKLTALKNIKKYPARVKCATLSWHTINQHKHNIETIE